jgi:hypothetical protein
MAGAAVEAVVSGCVSVHWLTVLPGTGAGGRGAIEGQATGHRRLDLRVGVWPE